MLMSSRNVTPAALCIGMAAVFAPAGQAGAQVLEEIVVTARRVEERLLDVPLSITAFTADMIEAARIYTMDDIAALTPGLSFFNLAGQQLSTPTIRGLAQTQIFGTINVGIFVDGVYVSGRRGINFSQLDLQQIAIVKGPQSALYGRDAFSGAINIVTANPGDEFFSSFEGTAGNEDRLGGRAIVSGPIIPGLLQGRAAFLYDEFDGSYSDPVNDRGVGGHRYRTFQGTLQATPTDDLTIRGKLYLSEDDVLAAPVISEFANCESSTDPTTTSVGRLLNYCGKFPKINTSSMPRSPGAVGEDRDLIRSSLNIDWDLDFGTLTSLTSYSRERQQNYADGAENLIGSLPYIYECWQGQPGCVPGQTWHRFRSGLLVVSTRSFTEEISQELRFTSPQDRPFRLTGGAYYYTVENRSRQSGLIATDPLPTNLRQIPGVASLILGLSGGEAASAWGPNAVDPRPSGIVDTSAWALFTAVEQDFLQHFTARAELRYTDEREKRTVFDYDPDITVVGPLSSFAETRSWSYFSGGLTLQYRPNDYWMTYAYLAKSKKPGGSELLAASLAADPSAGLQQEDIQRVLYFDEETNITTEFGIKGRTADGRIGLEAALYHTNWRNIVLPQVYERDPVTQRRLTRPQQIPTNGGDGRIWGWEMALDAAFTERLSGMFGVSFTDAIFTDVQLGTFVFFPGVPQVEIGVQPDGSPLIGGDVSGNQVQRQPKWQSNLALMYRRPLAGDWELSTRAEYNYRGPWFADAANQAIVPSQSLVNLTIGLDSTRYSIQLWARNLFADRSPVGAYRTIKFSNSNDIGVVDPATGDIVYENDPPAYDTSQFQLWQYAVSHPQLRTWGVTGKVRFGAGR